jgi:hypothetical protein
VEADELVRPRTIKVLTVVILLVLAAAVFVPRLLAPKVFYSEWSSAATLRNLARVQEEFRKGRFVDVDGDGVGEYGTLREMIGVLGLRTDASASARGDRLEHPLLSPALTPEAGEGFVRLRGYVVRLFLPAPGGGAVQEEGLRAPLSGPVDVDASEVRWCAYAWPDSDFARAGGDHIGALFVDAAGEVWRAPNEDGRYGGPGRGPAWDAAMPVSPGRGWASPPAQADSYRGRDGNLWTRCR